MSEKLGYGRSSRVQFLNRMELISRHACVEKSQIPASASTNTVSSNGENKTGRSSETPAGL